MDYRVFRALNGLATHGRVVDDVVRWIASYAALAFPIALVLLWLFPGTDPHRSRWATVIAAVAVVLALGVNQVLNHAVARPRPYAGHAVHLLLSRSHDNSFPSDHTALAFAVVAGLWPVRKRLSVVLALVATALAFARVIAGVHYPGDVLGGAGVGILSATLVWWVGRRPLGAVTAFVEGIYERILSPLRRLHPRRA